MQVSLDLEQLEEELGEESAEFALDLANELINQLVLHSPVGATGDLRNSWQIFQQQPGRISLGSRLEYSQHVWKGTGPIDNPPPPFQPFRLYARRKLGDEGAAGAVHTKIRQEGLDENPYVDDAIAEAIERETSG